MNSARDDLDPITIEANRFAREVQDVAWRPLHQRIQYFSEVEANRGKAVADKLRDAVAARWLENNPGNAK